MALCSIAEMMISRALPRQRLVATAVSSARKSSSTALAKMLAMTSSPTR
jgi:hypothetical protein